MSIKSLLLASVAYIVAGIGIGGLLANGSLTSAKPENLREAAVAAVMPVSNTGAKQDRLVATVALAMAEPDATGSLPQQLVSPVSIAPAETERATPAVTVAVEPPQAPRPKPVVKHQSGYSVLSDEQIASIKQRMKLTPYQEQHWPAIEAALHKIAARLHRTGKAPRDGAAPTIDPNSPEVQDLKSAAMPLLFTLSEDQKQEVRRLARVIGLDAVASAI